MSLSRSAFVVTALALAVTAGACAKKQPPVAAPPPPPPAVETTPAPPPPPPPPPPRQEPMPQAPTEDEAFARKTLEQLNAEQPLDDVFFAFDSFELSDMARDTLTANAAWMKRWPSARITIEGHCDNRGTPEYNIALGDRRARTVASYLQGLGIPADRVLTVSKGEEQPFCQEDTEGCWSQNRRGHFLITGK